MTLEGVMTVYFVLTVVAGIVFLLAMVVAS
jgi:hypothetical protein